MNNQLTTLAFSIYSNKGIYALLLGAGISKSAGILTGWDVTLDLIRKLAIQNKEKCEPTEVDWFVQKYKSQPNYSTILSHLVKTPTERVNLLKPYFEPTDEEQEQHFKEPSKAHKAIAQLAKKGYIKVVITTNFDRLLENALQDVGITPQIIRCIEDIDGALPLMHSTFTVIKINGDYLDCRFLNTEKELSDYPKKLKEYLLRIVNEFGLISCGWSAKWDIGLVSVIRQAESRRFNTFWTYLGECEKDLQELSDFRGGSTIEIKNADSFFINLQERVLALEHLNDNHPLNANIAVERLKKYIVKEENKILLHDLLQQETKNTLEKIQSIDNFTLYPNSDNLLPQIEKYKSAISILLPMCINGVYWCNEKQEDLFLSIVRKMIEPPKRSSGSYYSASIDIHYFPSIMILYTMGITAIITSKYKLLNSFFRLKYMKYEGDIAAKYIIEKFNPIKLFEEYDKEQINAIFKKRLKTPLSTILYNDLKDYFKEIFINEKDFENYFDVFEYLLSLNYLYIVDGNWFPVGQYIWKYSSSKIFLDNFFKEAEVKQSEWSPIKAGMFDGNYSKYLEVKQNADELINEYRRGYI